MKVTQIRNATLKLNYGGKTFLIDPMLSKKGEMPSFAPPEAPMPMSGNTERNPIVDLPMSVNEILSGVDAVIVTHLHPDHWDLAAIQLINKNLTVFSQNETDAKKLHEQGFKNVFVLEENTQFGEITLTYVEGRHASTEKMLEISGKACGIVFYHKNEKTLYLLGDTVWFEGVEKALNQYKPEIAIINAGNNQFVEGGPLIMGAEGVLKVHETLPKAQLMATHMEAVNHASLTREDLKEFAVKHNFDKKLDIPKDGETLEY